MTNQDSNLLNLYNDGEFGKIYSIQDENELQESDSFEWCPERSQIDVPPVVASLDHKGQQPQDPVPPDELPAFKAVNWQRGHLGVDIRPHLHDTVLDKMLLCDSGSQVTAVPPDPGDQVVQGQVLRAVNGSKIECYGYKDISIQIGRKSYPFKAIKANVDSIVLGWDFFRKHRLNLIWNDWGDMCIRDKKAKITSYMSKVFFIKLFVFQ